jgi:hypothetical protein
MGKTTSQKVTARDFNSQELIGKPDQKTQQEHAQVCSCRISDLGGRSDNRSVAMNPPDQAKAFRLSSCTSGSV